MKIKITVLLILLSYCFIPAMAQTELAPWGNIRGIRTGGQLMEFESSLRVETDGGKMIKQTGKERQRPKYERKDGQQIVTTAIGQLFFTETVQDGKTGSAKVVIEVTAKEDVQTDGIYFCISLPAEWYANATIQTDRSERSLKTDAGTGKKIGFRAAERSLVLSFTRPVSFQVRQNKNGNYELYVPIYTGRLATGETAKLSLTLEASGTKDISPVKLTIDTSYPGRTFDGFGGNFRLQNMRTDPQVIDYCLNNMRLAWGRVEMPWRFWHPQKTDDPLDSARGGKLHASVRNAMEMAQRLGKMGMPVVLSAWSPPAWAVIGEPRFSPGPDGVWGNPLDPANMQETCRSIGDYIQFVKEHYGVEFSMFSFNESDLGINIRQTGEEHAAFIKGLGAHLRQRGLNTKLLLGDNSDANSWKFIEPAMNDAAALPYIGAVSFHSWRGWEEPTLKKWADAATKLDLPLLVAEGSIDAQAWGYPQVFREETYAREEIDLYIRLLNISEPASILQWQLTSDYSPMTGGGIYGDQSPLQPIQRFWNLKQLASTPAALKALKAASDKKDVTIAALGDPAKGIYAIHLVNNGAARKTTLEGLPAGVKKLKVLVTDKNRKMQQEEPLVLKNGRIEFMLGTTTYTTLIAE